MPSILKLGAHCSVVLTINLLESFLFPLTPLSTTDDSPFSLRRNGVGLRDLVRDRPLQPLRSSG